MTFQKIPEHVLLFLVKHLEYDEAVSLISCCKEWYYSKLKINVRKLSLHFRDISGCEGWIERKLPLIVDPFSQLAMLVEALPTNDLKNFFRAIQNRMRELRIGNDLHFLEIMNSVENLTVKKLEIRVGNEEDSANRRKDVYANLLRVSDCESLSLHSGLLDHTWPFLASLQELKLNCTTIQPSVTTLLPYSRSLSRLELSYCNISDVSMFGSIPSLELKNCFEIEDISGLNNNDRVVISNCAKIRDFSHSFQNTRKLDIFLLFGRPQGRTQYTFDLTRWMKIEDLSLDDYNTASDIRCIGSNVLPKTVKKCRVAGGFVTSLDFTITSDHIVEEMEISNTTIKSLEGYGLERVRKIKCYNLSNLQSLQGIGTGRNCQVIISNCPEVADYSPLLQVPIVKIDNCCGFSNPLQVKMVQDLTITINCFSRISFLPLKTENSFEHIQSLTLENLHSINSLDGVESIRNLQLHGDSYQLINKLLEKGIGVRNQRIVLFQGTNRDSLNSLKLRNLHDQYMREDYDYYDQLPKRWIWRRKSF